jgi:NAD+ kinase
VHQNRPAIGGHHARHDSGVIAEVTRFSTSAGLLAGSLPGVAGGPEIALVLHPRRDPGPVLDAIGSWATVHGSRLLMRAEDAGRWDGEVTVVSDAQLAERAGAVVSLGGDGTMLGALRLVARRPVPVLGVNLGNLGFLVEVEPEELPDALDRLERLDFTIESHSALWLGTDDEAVAFNDLALVRVPGDGVVEATLAVGGQRMGRYRCDGLVMSTSIGSTAYAYSAGGPVVSPALDAVVVAALAPLAGISRPMVTAADESIRLTLQETSGRPAIEVDGTVLRRTEPGEALDVRLALGCGQVVRLDSDRHQRRKQVKLSLLDLPFLPDELRELAPPGSLPRSPRPPRAAQP